LAAFRPDSRAFLLAIFRGRGKDDVERLGMLLIYYAGGAKPQTMVKPLKSLTHEN
jgi:hypothetical protein